MPTYEYRCPKGHTFEVFHRMTDPAPAGCEVCGATPVERVLYPVAVHFKGSGFYATDYGKGKKKREGGKEDGAGVAEGTKAGTKAEGGGAEKKPSSSSSSSSSAPAD